MEMIDTLTVLPQLTEDRSRTEIDIDQHAEAPDEWGKQSFPASDPPQNW
jgi:hypothetical protein